MKPLLSCFLVLLVGCDSRTETAPVHQQSRSVAVPAAVSKEVGPTATAESQTIQTLRAENQALREQLKLLSQSVAEKVPATNQSGVTPSPANPADSLELELPPSGAPLNPVQQTLLMGGGVNFHPGSIPSSNLPVQPTSALQIGQEIQLKWGNTWWAATLSGFEEDGMIRAHYFGWESQYDEIVPRTDLQFDTQTKEKAIQTRWQLVGQESR